MPVLADKHRHDAQSRALPLPERRRTSIGTPALAQSTTTPTAWLAEWRLGLKMKPSGAPGHTPSTSPRQPAQPSPAQPSQEKQEKHHAIPCFRLGSWPDARPRGHTTTSTEKGTGRESRLGLGDQMPVAPLPFENASWSRLWPEIDLARKRRDRGNPAPLSSPARGPRFEPSSLASHSPCRGYDGDPSRSGCQRSALPCRNRVRPQTPLVLPIPSVGCGAKTSPG